MFQKLSLAIGFAIPCSLVGQGFNKRYDAFQWAFPQEGFGIERNVEGYAVFSGSIDCDSISPVECFTHVSVLLTQLDENGQELWEKRAWRPNHSSNTGWANCCDTIPGGGFVVGGSSEATDGSDEIYLMRFDANGDTLWTRVFGDPTLNRFWISYQVKRTQDGGFAMAGWTDQTGTRDGFALKTDSDGNEVWRETYGWSASAWDALGSVDLAGGGDLFMGGTRYVSETDKQLWVQRTTGSGELEWRVSWGGPWYDPSAVITTLLDGHVLVASGIAQDDSGDQFKPYLAKLDSTDGDILWEREYGPTAYRSLFFAGKECDDGDLIACGVSNASGDQQGLLLRATSNGDSLWMRSYYYQDEFMNDGEGRFYDVLPTPDGGFIAAGVAYGSASGNNPLGLSQDTWVVKVDGDGCIVPGCNTVGVTEQATNLKNALRLWPNPVVSNGLLSVELALPPALQGQELTLSVVDASGRLAHSQHMPNEREQLPAVNWPPGLYHLHISNGTRWYTGASFVVE